MPDITMCTSRHYQYRNKCYRVRARPDELPVPSGE